MRTGASVDNHKRLERKEIAVALTTSAVAFQAAKGLNQFDGKAQEDLQVLFVCDFSVMIWAVRADSGIAKLEDLAGAWFSPGIHGSGAELLTSSAFDLFGIDADLVHGTLPETVEGIKNRDLVGYANTGSAPISTRPCAR